MKLAKKIISTLLYLSTGALIACIVNNKIKDSIVLIAVCIICLTLHIIIRDEKTI